MNASNQQHEWSGIELYPPNGGDPRVEEVFTRIVGQGHTPSNYYRTLAYAPGALQPWIQLTKAVLEGTSLDRKLIELCILRMAVREGARYVWNHHVPMAQTAGVTAEQLAALVDWQDSPEFSSPERNALSYADLLFDNQHGGARSPLADGMSVGEVVELTVTLSFYIATFRMHRMLLVEIEPEKEVAEMPYARYPASGDADGGPSKSEMQS